MLDSCGTPKPTRARSVLQNTNPPSYDKSLDCRASLVVQIQRLECDLRAPVADVHPLRPTTLFF